MKAKVIPIKFNKDVLKEIEELEDLLGLKDTYGATAKVVKFGITLTLSALKNPQKVYFDLSPDKLELWFKSRAKIEYDRKERELFQTMTQNNRKV